MFSSRRYLHAPWHGSFQDASQLRWLLLQASNIHKILQLRLLCVNAVHHLWWWNTSCRTVNRPTRSWEQKLGLLTHWRWRRSTTLWRTPNISRHSSEPLERTMTTTLLPAMPSASSLRVPSLPPFIHLSSFCLLLTFPHSFSLFSSFPSRPHLCALYTFCPFCSFSHWPCRLFTCTQTPYSPGKVLSVPLSPVCPCVWAGWLRTCPELAISPCCATHPEEYSEPCDASLPQLSLAHHPMTRTRQHLFDTYMPVRYVCTFLRIQSIEQSPFLLLALKIL